MYNKNSLKNKIKFFKKSINSLRNLLLDKQKNYRQIEKIEILYKINNKSLRICYLFYTQNLLLDDKIKKIYID